MKYKIFEENGYLSGFCHTETEEDTYEFDASKMNLDYLGCYKVLEDSLEWDEEKYQTIIKMEDIKNEVARLKEELASTDYKAIKHSEGWLTDEEYEPIKIKRQELRNRINELEN